MKSSSPDSIRRLIAGAVLALLLAGCAATGGRPDAAATGGEPAQLPHNYTIGLSHMASGDFAAAVPVLQRFSSEHPELAGPWLNLSIALRHEGRADESREALDKSLTLNPDNPAAWQQLAILHRQQGHFDAALEAYDKALRLDPDYALAHRNLGILYDLYLQQPEQALDHYRRYQQLSDAADSDVSRWIVDLERRSGAAQARTNP